MNIQDLGAIGELIGSFAVVISLIYVALQLRDNTRSAKATEADEVSKQLQQMTESILRDPLSRRLFKESLLADKSYEDVPTEDRFELHLLLQAAMLLLWRSFKVSKLGKFDEDIWLINMRIATVSYFRSKVFHGWWRDNGRRMFPKDFIELVDEEIRRFSRSS
jgi:hypothetical protein